MPQVITAYRQKKEQDIWKPFVLSLVDRLDIKGMKFNFDIPDSRFSDERVIGYQSADSVHLLSGSHFVWNNAKDPNAFQFVVFVHECFHIHQWKGAIKQMDMYNDDIIADIKDNIVNGWLLSNSGIEFTILNNQITKEIDTFYDNDGNKYDDIECSALLFELRVGVGVLSKIGKDFEDTFNHRLNNDKKRAEIIFLLNHFKEWFEEYYPWLDTLYPVPVRWQRVRRL